MVSADFALRRAHLLDEVEAYHRAVTREALHAILLERYAQKSGTACALINWHVLETMALPRVLAHMPMQHLLGVCALLIRNLSELRRGLPDLFVVDAQGRYELVEVKGPNDQLQPGQRVWFRHFERLGIPARVIKLRLAQ